MLLRLAGSGRQRHATVPGESGVSGLDMGASVRARLLNKAKTEGQDFNLILTRYALEWFLYRFRRRGNTKSRADRLSDSAA